MTIVWSMVIPVWKRSSQLMWFAGWPLNWIDFSAPLSSPRLHVNVAQSDVLSQDLLEFPAGMMPMALGLYVVSVENA